MTGAVALAGALLSVAGVPDAAPHRLQGYVFGEHDGLQLDVPVSRVGAGLEYSQRLFGPIAAFGALEASVGKDAGAASYTPDITAKGGFEVDF